MAKKNNEANIVRVSEIKTVYTPRVRSGVFSFDLLTGGGVPLWKFTSFFGKESSGKTTMGLKVMNNFIKQYNKDAIYLDFENSFDKEWFLKFVEKPEKVILIQPSYGEEGIDIAVSQFKKDSVGFMLVDSLASIIPTADADKSAMEDTMGSIPRIVNKFLRKLIPVLAYKKKEEIPATIITLNQLTSNLQARAFQSQVKKPAGMFQNFVATLDIQFYTKEYKKKGDIPVAVTHQFTINKAKITGALPKRSGEYIMALVDFDKYKVGDILEHEFVFTFARKIGVIKQEKNMWNILGKSFPNIQDSIVYLKTTPKAMLELKEKCLQEGISKILEAEEEEEKVIED